MPFEQLVDMLNPARSMAHSPLFQVLFAWQNPPAGALELPGLGLQGIDLDLGVAKFDLSLSLAEAGDRIVWRFGVRHRPV